MHERVGLRGKEHSNFWHFLDLLGISTQEGNPNCYWLSLSSQSLTRRTKTPTFYPVCEVMAVYYCETAIMPPSPSLPPVTANPRYTLQVIVHRA
jgi:hypothetical protein